MATPGFHTFIKKTPLLRMLAFWQGRKLYDLVGGFVYSQILLATVELGLLDLLLNGPKTTKFLSEKTGLSIGKVTILCNAASSINLMSPNNREEYSISILGASVIGVSGLKDMIIHNKLFYEDLLDPVKLLKGDLDTKLSGFWPYVKSESSRKITDTSASEYSDLMASSQKIVAEETLRAIDLSNFNSLLDVGGGTGAFLFAVAKVYPNLNLTLYDLPAVIEEAEKLIIQNDPLCRIRVVAGNFVDDDLPDGIDVITLNRVLYDHEENMVIKLLKSVFLALNPGGSLIISEPMSGGSAPTRAGDAYFGFYTMAMTTGRPRSGQRHIKTLSDLGFVNIKKANKISNFITSVIIAHKPR